MDWEVYPRGLAGVLRKFQTLKLPIFVTENGVATGDDTLRCSFIEDHVEVLADAVGSGIDVRGYVHWSLLDNFEWDHGTGPRFGLAEVDFATQERMPRRSARVLAGIIEASRH